MDISGWWYVLIAVLAYIGIVIALAKTGRIGPDHPLTLFGPALMIKTKRGRALLDRWGRFRRFWTVSGDIGIGLAVTSMVAIVVLLFIDAIVAIHLSPSQAPSPTEALGIPGLNPIIPLGYGIVALVVGIVLHELTHGVIARSQKIGVKSLGVLWCVIPVGAFVEQDDEEMQKASRRIRDRVAAGGILANLVLAVVFFVGLSLVVSNSVAVNANGVGIAYIVPNTPAQNASLAPGDIITALNATPTPTDAALQDFLANSTAGAPVAVTYYSVTVGHSVTTTITLTSLERYTGDAADAHKGFLGIGISVLTPAQIRSTLINPFASSSGPLIGGIDWIVLPLATIEPVQGATSSFFHVSGPLGGGNAGTFWIAANILYWLAWMNLLLGISNALPLVPLDGGLLFRDFAATLAARIKRGWSEARVEQFGGQAVAFTSILVLVLLVWQFVVPRL